MDRVLQQLLPLELRFAADLRVHLQLAIVGAVLWVAGLFPGPGAMVVLLILGALMVALFASVHACMRRLTDLVYSSLGGRVSSFHG